MAAKTTQYSNRQRAAIVVMTLGEQAKPLLDAMGTPEVQLIAEEITRLGKIEDAERDLVVTEFLNKLAVKSTASVGGLERAAEMLDLRFGENEGSRVLKRLEWKSGAAINSIARKDPDEFAAVLERENPQTGAFLVTQLEVDLVPVIMEKLEAKRRQNLLVRVAKMREISPDVALLVYSAFDKPEVVEEEVEALGGEQAAASLLNFLDMESQKDVLDGLAESDNEMAMRVKKLMFVFRDLLLLDDRSMQSVLKMLDQKDLIVALTEADAVIAEKFFTNMSSRAADAIKEEMGFLGKVPKQDIEDARQRVIDQVRELEEKGEIVIDRTGGE